MAEKGSKTGLYIALGAAGCALAIPVCGIVAAVALPALLGYVKRSKTAEAEANLAALATGLEGYRMELGTYPTRSLPATPAIPGPDKQMWPLDADPGWAELGFSIADPIYYSYEYVADPTGQTYTIRARGDLDGDGLYSLFERTSDSPNVYVEDELE